MTFIGSIVGVGILSFFMVELAERIGATIGIPDVVMGIVFLAAGASARLPRFVAFCCVLRGCLHARPPDVRDLHKHTRAHTHTHARARTHTHTHTRRYLRAGPSVVCDRGQAGRRRHGRLLVHRIQRLRRECMHARLCLRVFVCLLVGWTG